MWSERPLPKLEQANIEHAPAETTHAQPEPRARAGGGGAAGATEEESPHGGGGSSRGPAACA